MWNGDNDIAECKQISNMEMMALSQIGLEFEVCEVDLYCDKIFVCVVVCAI